MCSGTDFHLVLTFSSLSFSFTLVSTSMALLTQVESRTALLSDPDLPVPAQDRATCQHHIVVEPSSNMLRCTKCQLLDPPDLRYYILPDSEMPPITNSSTLQCQHPNLPQGPGLSCVCPECTLLVSRGRSAMVPSVAISTSGLDRSILKQAVEFVYDFDGCLRGLDQQWGKGSKRQASISTFEKDIADCLRDGCHGGGMIIFHDTSTDNLVCRFITKG